MSTPKKILLISLATAATIVVILLMTVFAPIFKSLTDVAYNDPSAGNYPYYHSAVGMSPFFLFGLPIVIGAVVVVVILLRKNKQGQN
jgi:hypothetical protein